MLFKSAQHGWTHSQIDEFEYFQTVFLQNAQLFLKNPSSSHTLSLQNVSAVFQIQDLEHII